MTRPCDICNARDCTVSPGGDVGGVARPAVCWRCRGDDAPECAEGGCEDCEPLHPGHVVARLERHMGVKPGALLGLTPFQIDYLETLRRGW